MDCADRTRAGTTWITHDQGVTWSYQMKRWWWFMADPRCGIQAKMMASWHKHDFCIEMNGPWCESMWGKIMIPMYRLWLHGLYGLYGPRNPLSPERPLNLITQSLTRPWCEGIHWWLLLAKVSVMQSFVFVLFCFDLFLSVWLSCLVNIELTMIWDAMTSVMWRHCNGNDDDASKRSRQGIMDTIETLRRYPDRLFGTRPSLPEVILIERKLGNWE